MAAEASVEGFDGITVEYLEIGKLARTPVTRLISIECGGMELEAACDILGRPLPSNKYQPFLFIGQDARTILVNWR